VQSENQVEPFRFTLSLIELSGFMLINTLLGFAKSLKATPVADFARTIDHVRWSRPQDIYASETPHTVVEQLEYLRKRLSLERFVEGHLISPVWFRQQIAASGFARFISQSVNHLVARLESTYLVQIETLLKEQRTLLAVQLIQTGMEACQKYRAHFEDVKVYTEQLISLRRVADIPWTVMDWNDVDIRVRAIRTRLVIALGQALPAMAALPQAEQWPDYFGLAYSVLSQEAYNAIATGDESLFQRIIPSVFVACLTAPSRVAEQLQDIDAKMRFIYSTEPIEDILELSGYTLIFSELDGKAFWDTMKAQWNTYIVQQSAPQDEVDRLMNIIKARQAWPTIFPRAFVRTTWRQDLEDRLRDRGLLNASYTYEPHGSKQKWHTSAIIRALTPAGHWKLFDSPLDVFLVVYAREQNTTWHLNLPKGTESFSNALQREEAKDNDTKES
jgi:hypothetical protein